MKRYRSILWGRLLSAWRNENGGAAAEFALVLPIFLMMVFGTVYTCYLVGALVELHEVTENAARCLSVDTTGACTITTINTYAKGRYVGPTITGLNFVPSAPACGNQVVGTGKFTLFTGAGNITVNLTGTACYPII